jgi:hypothetical protein
MKKLMTIMLALAMTAGASAQERTEKSDADGAPIAPKGFCKEDLTFLCHHSPVLFAYSQRSGWF